MTEHKKAFFALYFGQDVFFDNMNFKVEGIDVLRDSWIQGIHAELRPLSDISDEDAIELSNLLDISVSVGDIREALIQVIGRSDIDFPIKVIDILRSKGYAIPFMGYSIGQLIEAGWVKEKPKSDLPSYCKEKWCENVCDECPFMEYEVVGHPGGENTQSTKQHFCAKGIWKEDF